MFITVVYAAIVGRRGADRQPRCDPLVRRRRRPRAGVPARAGTRPQARRPARLRQARDALRGPGGLLRPGRRGLRRRTTSCLGWRRCSPAGPAPTSRPSGCASATTLHPSRRSPTDADAGAAGPRRRRSSTRASRSARSPCRCRRPTPWIPPRSKLVEDLAAQAGLGPAERPADRGAARVTAAAGRRAGRGATQARTEHPRRRPATARGALGPARACAADRRPRPGEGAGDVWTSCRRRAGDALEDLRDLARGIYPPLLADKGLRRGARGAGAEGRGPDDGASPTGSAATTATSRPPSTSARSRRSTTSRSTPRRAPRRSTSRSRTAGFASRSATTARGFDPGATAYGTGLQGMADRLDAIGGSLHGRRRLSGRARR